MRPILIEEIRREKCNQSMLSGYNQAVASGLIEQGEKMPEDIAEEYDNTINRGLGHEYEKYVNVQGMEIDKAMKVHIAKQMKALGLNYPINVVFSRKFRTSKGWVEEGNMNTIFINPNYSNAFKRTSAHELTHLKQYKKKELQYDDNKNRIWKGKLHSTAWEMDKILRNAHKSYSHYLKYENLPWEKEAFTRGDKYVGRKQSPSLFKKARKKSNK